MSYVLQMCCWLPRVNVMEKAQNNSHCLEPHLAYVNGVIIKLAVLYITDQNIESYYFDICINTYISYCHIQSHLGAKG